MKKTIITIAIILAMPLVFAMIAGENHTATFTDTVRNCYIEDSQGILSNNYSEGLSFTEYQNKVIINTNPKLIPDEYIISCEVRGQREEQSSSSGSSGGGYVKDWSTKCGYNKECLYGSNVTELVNTSEFKNKTIGVTEDIDLVVGDEKTSTGKIIMIGLFVVAGIVFIILLFKKIFKGEEIEPEISQPKKVERVEETEEIREPQKVEESKPDEFDKDIDIDEYNLGEEDAGV